MKQVLIASAFCLATVSAHAGGYSDPVVTPEVVAAESAESASPDDGVVIIMFLLVAAAALAS